MFKETYDLILMLPVIFDNNVQFFNQRPICKRKSYFAISFVDEEYKLTIVAKNIYPSQYIQAKNKVSTGAKTMYIDLPVPLIFCQGGSSYVTLKMSVLINDMHNVLAATSQRPIKVYLLNCQTLPSQSCLISSSLRLFNWMKACSV
jgi:hypothetical protein